MLINEMIRAVIDANVMNLPAARRRGSIGINDIDSTN
jgi:hypothetical protein